MKAFYAHSFRAVAAAAGAGTGASVKCCAGPGHNCQAAKHVYMQSRCGLRPTRHLQLAPGAGTVAGAGVKCLNPTKTS